MPYTVGAEFNNLPQWYKDIVESNLRQSESLRRQEYPVYPGARVAELNPYMSESYKRLGKLGIQNPYLTESAQLMRPSQGTYAQQIEPYMNPFLRHVVEGIGREGTRTFRENILPALEAKFVNLGQHGSSRHRQLSERAARDIQNEIMNRQQQALAHGYSEATGIHNAEKMRNLEAARGLGNLGLSSQQAQMQDINMINAMGVQQQAQKQHELNEKQAEFWRRQMWPHQALAQQTSVLQGTPAPSMGSTHMAYEPPQQVPTVNPLGQIGSMATQLYGLSQLGGQSGQPRLKKGGHLGLSSIRFMKRKKRR
jgi:hypothetical protein